jgi:hypothetical protein
MGFELAAAAGLSDLWCPSAIVFSTGGAAVARLRQIGLLDGNERVVVFTPRSGLKYPPPTPS